MRKIRIGNDIAVQWSLVAKGTGEPFVVEGKDIRLSLKSIFSTTEIEDFTAQGNKIAWTFKGAEQKQTGIYSLVVSVVDAQGAMVTTDVCQFVELVACSCEADGADEAGVHTESIDLVSNVEIGVGSSYDDRELREAIADLDNQVSARREEIMNLEYSKADKSELTELSEEVSGLSERVDNLPTAESSVFEAVYGETTYEEIVAAFNEKKHVLCLWNDMVYNLSAVTANLLNFSCVKGSVIYTANCKADNTWGSLQYNVEYVRNKVSSLTSASTDAQYPSAKAVYDFVNNTLGTIINGDY